MMSRNPSKPSLGSYTPPKRCFWRPQNNVARNRRQRLRLYCDTQSLLLRLAASRKLKRVIPRHFLFSEIDVEMQILEVVRALESPVTFEHVEGHQDTKYPERPLSWAAQLKLRCDETATDQLDAASQPIPTVTFLPASHVSISVGAHTLTLTIISLHNFGTSPGSPASGNITANIMRGFQRPSSTLSTGHYFTKQLL
jgi:hypothetical protein